MYYTKQLNEVKQACKTLASRAGQIVAVDKLFRDPQFVGALEKAKDGLKKLTGTTLLTHDENAYAEMTAVVEAFVATQNSLEQFPTKENKRTCQEHLEHEIAMLAGMKRHLEEET